MQLTTLDWVIVFVSLAVSFAPAVWMARRAGSSTAEFFTSGRAAPWWLVGVSMVATTFSTDTPNLVTNLVREGGVASNWAWWAFLLTGMTTVFFYARLWRRLGVLTDLEFYELRYSGRAATWVRGFRAVYLGVLFNVVIMASVNLAAAKIANVLLGWSMGQTLLVCGLINVAFAATSGLWGVLVTDFLQFGIALSGSFAAAYYAVRHPAVGGLDGLFARIDPSALAMMPDLTDWSVAVPLFIVPLAVQWWSTWYPGSEPGGGSYVAQRMLAARSERDAMGGTLLYNVAHYAVRPWPWIVVALASMLVFPEVADIRRALPHVDPALVGNDMAYPAMLTFLPAGVLGLMVAGLLAAYVSTISTHLNWGTSYLVHDLYRRFLRPDATEAHYVLVGRLVTAALMLAAGLLTLVLDSARTTFNLLLSIGAGTGLLYLLRWFWWRINAWSEIAAMASSFVLALALFLLERRGIAFPQHLSLVATVAVTTVVWLAATWLTPATDRATLRRFYTTARPAGPGWAAIRRESGGLPSSDDLWDAFTGCAASCAFVYSALFGAGHWLMGH
ncbi:MAG: Na+:solute symporter, partial [Acidobacteriota bacterium]|nr:Na+:solute symporter [Acidobacteriota bacterium]